MAPRVRAVRRRPGRARRRDERSRHGRRVDRRHRPRARRHRRGPRARSAPASQRRQDPTGRRRCRRWHPPAGLLRCVQHGRRRSRPARHARHHHAQRHGHRATQAAGRVVQRHAVLELRARLRRRPQRHPGPRLVARGGRRPQVGPRPRPRRALRPRDQPQPARCHVGRRGGPRSGGASRVAVRHPRSDRRRRRGSGGLRRRVGRHRRRRLVWPVRCAGAPRCLARTVTDLDQQPPHRARDAADQQRGRRLQLRDARARTAQPHVRPGQGARRRAARPLGPRG